MSPADRARLAQAVQTNCHIADARHAADLTLCTYLLQMREFHRWERGLPFGAPLDRAAVGAWIAEREALWDRLEAQDFEPLHCTADQFDPFDVAAINQRLQPLGLVYGAGLVGAERPVFFLAELHGQMQREGLAVTVAGRELARGLAAPPAGLTGGDGSPQGLPQVWVRRESLARWCWERFEAFSLRQPAGHPFHAAVQAYGLDQGFDAALPRWLDEQAEAVLLHEIGEHRAGQRLGPGWSAMRLALRSRRADLLVRAVRDHLADLTVTLPTLLDRGADASVHVWFAALDGLREALFPSLKAAYSLWRGGDGGQALGRAIEQGERHFEALAQQALALHAALPDASAATAAIERLLSAPEAAC